MSGSPVGTEKKRECPRCGEAVGTSNPFWIDGTLKDVVVCDECAKPLREVVKKLALARDTFVRMVYEHPGHEKQAPAVVGHVVMTVRLSTEEELAKFGWQDDWPTDVLVLTSGAIIIPASDEEKNEPGALRGIYNDGRTFEFEETH